MIKDQGSEKLVLSDRGNINTPGKSKKTRKDTAAQSAVDQKDAALAAIVAETKSHIATAEQLADQIVGMGAAEIADILGSVPARVQAEALRMVEEDSSTRFRSTNDQWARDLRSTSAVSEFFANHSAETLA